MKDIILILYDIRSIYNVGSIFRTSDAAGVKKIYLCGITPTPIDRFGRIRSQFAKISLGSEKTTNWEKISYIKPVINKIKKGGYKVFAIEQSEKSEPYYKLKSFIGGDNKKIAVILGNEISGLPKRVLNLSDKILEIPMLGKKESLNVSVAAGIVLYRIIY